MSLVSASFWHAAGTRRASVSCSTHLTSRDQGCAMLSSIQLAPMLFRGPNEADHQPGDSRRDPQGETLGVWAHVRDGRLLQWLGGRLAVKRRLLAACLFGAGLVLTLVSSLTSSLHTCVGQIARVGTVPTVQTCDPLSITDAPILVLLIGAVALLVPDLMKHLTGLEIPGVLRIERKVEEQGRRQEDILRLIQQIDVSQNQNQQVILTTAAIAELVGLQPEKRRRFESDAP